jgi:nondiscriminating aspartyl-tRNA synthetase
MLQTLSLCQYVELDKLSDKYVNISLTISGRIHTIRKGGPLCFLILRDRLHTLQCIGFKKTLGSQFTSLLALKPESYIHLTGKLTMLPAEVQKVESCSYKNFEFTIDSFEVISVPVDHLPFELDDANTVYTEETDRSKVLLPTRLDNRYFDLRTPLNYCIFRLQSGIVNAFRTYMLSKGYTEIHSPKLLGTSSETGAAVFEVKYFEKKAYLAQSPQLYKQMMINADHVGVFEIGPVFRAENSVSHSHLCEFTGLDLEMRLSAPYDFTEPIRQLWNCLRSIFSDLETNYKTECEYLRSIHTVSPLIYPEVPLMINFAEGVAMLIEAGYSQDFFDDLTTENEKQLGKLVFDKYGSELFVLTHYPTTVRPFYTMLSSEDHNYTNSYDIIMRGREICSGSQRVHDYEELKTRILSTGATLAPFEDYLNSFKYGSRPHGGGGFGLERILMLYFNLENVRVTSLFPRDPHRLSP